MRALWLLLLVLVAADSPREPELDLRTGGDTEVEEGRRGAASLTVAPRSGHFVHRGAPLIVELSVEPAAGLELTRTRFQRKDAADPQAEAPRFDLPFSARKAGDYRIQAQVSLWICRKRTCRPLKQTVALPVTVRPPRPPGDGGPGPGASR